MKNLNKEIKIVIVLLIMFLLLVFLHYTRISSPLENLTVRTLSPVQNYFYNLSYRIHQFYLAQLNKIDLAKENDSLYEKLSKVTIDQSRLLLLEEENKSLKQILNYISNHDIKNKVTAAIIGQTTDNFSNFFIINQGEDAGIKIGDPVIAQEGIIVGKINKVYKYSAQVLFLTDNNSKLAATIQNTDKTLGIVQGEHNLSLSMDLIPQNEVIETNALVITSGLESQIPKGLIIGTVEKISNESQEIFQKATITPLIPYNKLNIVTVLITPF